MNNIYLHDLFKSISEGGKRIAIEDKGKNVSYEELFSLTKKVANFLKNKNLSNHLIPIFLEGGADYAALVMGAWLIGYAAIPMGPSFPKERIDFIMDETKAEIMVDEAMMAEIKKGEEIKEYEICDENNLSLIIYTSGSTGNPKGIMHTFKGLYKKGDFKYKLDDCFLMIAPFYFVASLTVYKVLKEGAKVAIPTDDIKLDIHKLEDYIASAGITYAFLPPSVLKNFHNKSDKLKVVFTGSEKLVGEEGREGYKLINCYGMTETLGTVCNFLVDKKYDSTPVGKTNYEYKLIDDDGNVVPKGSIGEFCIKGNFTIGYFNDPEKTKKLIDSEGFYHTNDLLRELPDGNLVYVNRKDWMVKINGQRVEVGEVEVRIKDVEGVQDAIVKGFENKEGNAYLCAFYKGEATPEAIKEALMKLLPPYMIPLYFIKVMEFSYLPNGKINRKVLEAPDLENLTSDYEAPANKTEEAICKAYETVFGLTKSGRNDDFFLLGGDSIKVMKLTTILSDLNLSSKTIYKEKTPKKIALALTRDAKIHYKDVKKAPLSQTQLGIYTECMLNKGKQIYNNPILLKLDNKVDADKLAEAIEKTIEAHKSIKVHIKEDENSVPFMEVYEDKYVQKIENVSNKEFEEIKKNLVQPFDIEHDELFRINIFKTEDSIYLFTDFHHIIYDGTSMKIFTDDLNNAYNGSDVEEEKYTILDIALNEENTRKTEVYTEAQKWYLDTFSPIELDSKPLPDKAGSDVSFKMVDRNLEVDADLLTEYAKRLNLTLNVITTGAFAYLLSIYKSQREALFATIYNGRSDLITNRTIAMMVKTLPVYAKYDEKTRISDYLNEIRNLELNAMNNDIYSFAELAANSNCNSDVLFAYQGDYLAVGNMCGYSFERIPLEMNATGAALNVQLFKYENKLNIKLEYKENEYSETFINHFINALDTILTNFMNEERITSVDVLNKDELALLDSFNDNDVEYDEELTIPGMFVKAAKVNAERPAVVFKDVKLTYKEVDEATYNLASLIQEKGLKRGDVASILIPRCELMPICGLAAMRASVTYQPLDATYPVERLNFMVKDANAKLLITTPELRELITDFEGEVILLNSYKDIKKTNHKLVEAPSKDDIMILLYTSGSTGVPKGVRLSQKNITCFVLWYQRYFKLTKENVAGAYASFGFDANMMDTYPTLSCGAKLVILPEEYRLDLSKMDEYFESNGVTHQFLTTQVGRQYGIDGKNKHLKYLSMGGEKLIAFDISDKYETFNVYGPTECSVLCTAYKLQKGEKNVPIGPVIDNFKGYVVGLDQRRVPVGALGELYISGNQVGQGYLNREEKTKEVFIENPFDKDNPKYLNTYRTGDIVRFKEDGVIEFVGRQDGQVKIRGFRIELSEVEEAIRGYKGIKDVAVKAFDHPAGGKYLCAYIVSDLDISFDDVKKYILGIKPPYMVPQFFVKLDRIPLNQNGKVNRRALEEPQIELTDEKEDRKLNPLEEKLKEIALNVLNVKDVSITRSLYEFGLTSILSIKLLVQIYKEFNIDISPKDLNNDISIENIENYIISYWLNGNNQKEEIKIESFTEAPLSYAQTGVYFECIKDPNSLSYNMPSVFKFNKNKITTDKLINALKLILSAHKQLNVHFENKEGKIIQTYNDYEIEPVVVNEDVEEYKKKFIRPFDLANGPLVRFEIIEADAIYLFIDFHHLVFDGASMSLFITNLKKALGGEEIEAETYDYFNHVYDEIEEEKTDEYQNRLDYFKDMFSSFESSTEVTNDLNLGGTDLGLSYAKFDFDKLDKFAKNNEFTPAQVMLAAIYYVVARYVNDKNVFISTISNGRSNLKLSNIFGMFVNTIPLHLQIRKMKVMEFINLAKKSFNDALANEAFPFAKINELYHFSPSIVYEYQLGVIEKYDILGLEEVKALEQAKAKFKLAIHIENHENKPAIVMYYNKGLYSKDLMDNMAEAINIVLNKLIDNPEENILHVDLLNDERRKEVEAFGKIETGPISFKTYHGGLEIQAVKNKDKLALVATDARFTFDELNRKANRLAHSIADMGIRDSRIIILLPRTSSLIVSIFGIMKSGNAYIPCDPNYPKERINLIMEDSGAKLIITTKEMSKDYDNAIDVEELFKNKNEDNLNLDISEEDLCYLIYTSGSTGRPKGVMLRHRGVCNYHSDAKSNIYVQAVKPLNAFLAVTTISFDMSVKEIGTPLTNGVTVVLAEDSATNDPVALAKLMKENHIDGINATPSRLRQYLDVKEFEEAVKNCKFIVSGGEKYPLQLLDYLQKNTHAQIMNTYGPTEISVSCNMKDLTKASSISVGKPLYNVIEFVVDSDGNELPRGVVGELYIGGQGVGKGYNNLEDKTKAAFITYKGIPVYKSGDYARWLPNGDVEILGRTDNQIKLRGLRIELGEIESALAKATGITNSVVKIMTISNVEHLCAYFTADTKIDVHALKDELSQTLTKYMVPTAYLQLAKMPLTPNGKIDVKNLPEPELLDVSSHEAPKNDTEKLFCDIFKEILNLPDVGATDSFFDIGGTSLSAIRVTVGAAKAGYTLTYPDVFSNPTPRALAKFVGGKDNIVTEAKEDEEVIDYDYAKINEILAKNTLESYFKGEKLKVGNILLTGPTGYLGIHILHEFLENYDGKAFCLLRSKGDMTAEARLQSQLFYYTEKDYHELFNRRIFVIEGDITKELNIKDEYIKEIDTIINSAAVVKHFSQGTEIEDVNVGGVKNLLGFAEKHNIKYVQISTASTIKAPQKDDAILIDSATEQMLYIDQILNNKYVRSKFLAERLVLEAVAEGKVTAKIMRVGNLAPRDTDGDFQINFNTNSAMGRIKSFSMLGCISYNQLTQSIEFSPIDNVSTAILKLIETPKECVVFHPLNNHKVLYADLVKAMNEVGLNVKAVEAANFVKALELAENDPNKAKVLTSMLAYKGNNVKPPHMPTADTTYTMQILYRMGFSFAETSKDYLTKFLDALAGLGFFDI